MDESELTQLMSAYGFTLEQKIPTEKKWRFRGHTMFIDVWMGRRGITMGTYSKQSQRVFYTYRMTPFTLEDQLLEIAEKYPV